MFIIAFRASYKGARWWFVAAFDSSEADFAEAFAKDYKAGNGLGDVECFKWEWA